MSTLRETISGATTRLWHLTPHYAQLSCEETEGAAPRKRLIVKNIMPWHLDTLTVDERSRTLDRIAATTLFYRSLLGGKRVPLAPEYECYAEGGYAIQLSPSPGHNPQ